MEMKKLLAFTILAAAAASISANAMDWRYGILASYDNTGTVWLNNGKPNNMSSTSGFSVGAMVGYDFIDYFGIQSGLMFSMTDINSAEEYEGEHFGLFDLDELLLHMDIRMYYLSIPLFLQGKLPVGNVDLILEAGPQFYCGVASRITTTLDAFYQDYLDIYELEGNQSAYDYLQRFNCMIHFGIGAEYMGARFMVGYNLGVYNIARNAENDPERSDLRTRGFSITAGYVF